MALARRKTLANAAIVVTAFLAVAGCQTASVDDLVPLAGARNTGTYPDLNTKQVAETSQLTVMEAEQQVEHLKAARAAQGAGASASSTATPAEIHRAAQRQKKVLEEIEKGD